MFLLERLTLESIAINSFTGLPVVELTSSGSESKEEIVDNLTKKDRNELGGLEYRSIKLLLKVVIGKQERFCNNAILISLHIHLGYYFGVYLFGAIGLVGWIRHADPKYVAHLDGFAQDKIWWYVNAR